MSYAIVAEELQKQFGEVAAVREVNLRVRQGICFGFVGPNGAGKTTTIRLLAGLLKPSAGRVEILGQFHEDAGSRIRARIGLVQDDTLLYDYLTGDEQLLFTGRIYGMDQNRTRERMDELFSLLSLNDCRNRLIRTCSHGERKKLAMACALIHDPDLLFLDEPFEGMDVMALRALEENLVHMVARGRTVFLTSHILHWVDRLCPEIAVIDRGAVVFFGTRDAFREAALAVSDRNAVSEFEKAFLSIIRTETSDRRLSWLR